MGDRPPEERGPDPARSRPGTVEPPQAPDAPPAPPATVPARGDPVGQATAGRAPDARSAPRALVTMRDVGKRFGQLWAVRGLSLDVPEGSIVGLIGPSGCGKTTTVRLMLGVYEPTEGEIEVLGERPFRFRRATRERLGYLPQLFVLYPTLTVDENLNFAAAAYGLGPFKRRRFKRQALDLVGLGEHRRTLASNISGGMQRRLELAATLLHQPQLIVMDEPTAGIDPILREQLWEEFRRLQALGRTQVLTTQYVTEAEYCDWVVLMDEGKVAAAGTPDALRRQAAGGDLIDVTVPTLDRPLVAALRALPGVVGVQRHGDTEVRLVVDGRAGELIPSVVDAVQDSGATVQRIEEYSLSFNEVFVALLGQQGQPTQAVRHVD